jgi:uncharacterized membrane protein YkvA (DUF1232 family)
MGESKVIKMRVLTNLIDWVATPYSFYLLLNNPSISWRAKLKAGLILAAVSFYILDPIDLIPDIIPILGWFDDLFVVSLGMAVAAKVVPEISVADIRQKARSKVKRIMFWAIVSAIAIGLIGLCLFGTLIYFTIKHWL